MSSWQPPQNYQPDPNLEVTLKTTSPQLNTPLFDMVVYWDWRTRPIWRKTIKRAWDDLGMTPEHAREALDQRLVLLEIYDKAERRALEED